MIQKLILVFKDIVLGSILGIFVYSLGILQSYYIYFDFVPAIMNIITPLFALFIELYFIVTKNKKIYSGLVRIIVMLVVMFLLTGFNYKIYTFVVNKFNIYESPMIDNTSGLCSVLYILFVFIGAVVSIVIIRKKNTQSIGNVNTGNGTLYSNEK